MTKKKKVPSTPALRALTQAAFAFEVHTYDYVERGGTQASAAALQVDEHMIIKTLVFEDERKKPFIVLMHGDAEVSAKELARQIGSRSARPCDPTRAQSHSGYKVGGTSPFGTRKTMPIYAESTIFDLERLIINGGARGLLVEITPDVLEALLAPTRVHVARAK